MKATTISHKFPCYPCTKKGQTNILHPAVILTILPSCGDEAVEGPSVGKGGGKKPKFAKKKKAKKMEKENDLVGSSQGSDSQHSEAEDK